MSIQGDDHDAGYSSLDNDGDDISCIGSEDLVHEDIDEDEKRKILDDEPDLAEAEELLKEDLARLTAQRRQAIECSVKGVGYLGNIVFPTPHDDHTKIQGLLQSLSDDLDNLPFPTPTYDLAKAMYSSYIRQEDFCAKFLRAEAYDPVRAATRLNKYLELVFEYFGPDALVRPIVMTDLNKEEQTLLKTGIFQAVPGRDWSGRRMIAQYDEDLPSFASIENVVRIWIYVLLDLSDDVVTQKRGLVSISMINERSMNKLKATASNDSDTLIDNALWRFAVRKMVNVLPLKIAAIHVAMPRSQTTDRTKAYALFAMGSRLRPHIRFHVGNRQDTRESLNKYGIPVDLLPSWQAHQKWIAVIQTKDKAQRDNKVFPGIVCPQTVDVVFGKGQLNQCHSGNIGMQTLIKQNYGRYNSAVKEEKTLIVHLIYSEIMAAGGEFLKQHEALGYWYPVAQDDALKKIAMGFRDYRKKIVKKSHAKDSGKANQRFLCAVQQALEKIKIR